jgi:hypothetical protein
MISIDIMAAGNAIVRTLKIGVEADTPLSSAAEKPIEAGWLSLQTDEFG